MPAAQKVWIKWKTGGPGRNKWQEFASARKAEEAFATTNAKPKLTTVLISSFLNHPNDTKKVTIPAKATWAVSATRPADADDVAERLQSTHLSSTPGPGPSTTQNAAVESAAPPTPPTAALTPAPPSATSRSTRTLRCLTIERPDMSVIWTFEVFWAWLAKLLKASRESGLSTVAQGTIFEVVVLVCKTLIHQGKAKVSLVGASEMGSIGDDGQDITVKFNQGQSGRNEVIDCKNYGSSKGTRPQVRSVIGALMTSDLTTGRGTNGGVGTLLVTSTFMDKARECADLFNGIWEDAGYEIKLMTFEEDFKKKLRANFQENDGPALLNSILNQLSTRRLIKQIARSN